jgi:hypothetical protein
MELLNPIFPYGGLHSAQLCQYFRDNSEPMCDQERQHLYDYVHHQNGVPENIDLQSRQIPESMEILSNDM